MNALVPTETELAPEAIIRRFLIWSRSASASERTAAASALGRAFLESPLSAEERSTAEAALTVLLDDPSAAVRRALANVLASSTEAPRHVILALANDASDIAAIVLARSPLILDAELVDVAAGGDDAVQIAVAERRPLSAAVSAALCEVADAQACSALLQNDAAEIVPFSLARLVDRLGTDAAIRDLLLERPDLPIALRQRLISDLSSVLGGFLVERGGVAPQRADHVTREALDRATLTLAEAPTIAEIGELVEHLAETGQLTPALILQAICAGNVAFFEESLVALTGLPRRKVYAAVADRRSQALHALYRRAGLPLDAYPAFQTALDVIAETELPDRPNGGLHYSRQVLERVLTRYQHFARDDSDHLLLLLRRLAGEAARDHARRYAEACIEAEPHLALPAPRAA